MSLTSGKKSINCSSTIKLQNGAVVPMDSSLTKSTKRHKSNVICSVICLSLQVCEFIMFNL